MKTFLKLKHLFLFTVMFCISASLFSQESVLEVKKDGKIKQIKAGKIIRIWIGEDKIKGRLDSITNHSVFIEDKEYEIEDIDKLGIKFKGTQIAGAILGTAGLAFTGLGTAMIIGASNSSSDDLGEAIGKIFIVAFGIIIDGIGITATAIGASVFFIGKKYKTDKGWTIEAVQMN